MSSLGRLNAVTPDVWHHIARMTRQDLATKRESFYRDEMHHHRAMMDAGYADWGIPYPKDLHHLAMTCRTLYDLYTPALFRHMHIRVNRLQAVLTALDKRPRLYEHLRSLTFHLSRDWYSLDREGEASDCALQWEMASKAQKLMSLRIEPFEDAAIQRSTLDLPDLEVLWLSWLRYKFDIWQVFEPLELGPQHLLDAQIRPRVLCVEGIAVDAYPTLDVHLSRVEQLTLHWYHLPGSSLSIGPHLSVATELFRLTLVFRALDWPHILRERPSSWPDTTRSKLRSAVLRREEFCMTPEVDRNLDPKTEEEAFKHEPQQSPSLLSSFSSFPALEELTLPVAHRSALQVTDTFPISLQIFTLALPWPKDIQEENVTAIQIDALVKLCSHIWSCIETYIGEGRAPSLREVRVGETVPWMYWALQHSLTFPQGKDSIARFGRFRSYCASQDITVTVEGLSFEDYWRRERPLWPRSRSRQRHPGPDDSDMTAPIRPSKSLIYRYPEWFHEDEDNRRVDESPPSSGTERGNYL